MSEGKRYLGDGVYYSHDGFLAVLTTEDGGGASNTIYLDPSVIVSLLQALGERYGRSKLCQAIGIEVEQADAEET